MKKPLLISFCVFCLCPLICFAQLNSKESSIISRFGNQLKTDVENDHIKGSISAVVIKGNKIIWANAYGYADRDRNVLADTNTIYRIGSITKTFTATLLMLLVEEKKISLDDLAEKYVPEVKNIIGYSTGTKITIRQLASHTSGLKREPDAPNANIGSVQQWESKLLYCIPYTTFANKPGEQFLYSNIGYAILGLALQRAAGQLYMDMVQQKIIVPLHMEQTFFSPTDNKMPNLAEGLYNNSSEVNTKIPLREHGGRGYRVPNGSLYSTPRDLAKLVISVINKQLLSKPSLQKMQEIPNGGKNYGLGLFVHSNSQVNIIGHDGSVAGYTSAFLIEQNSKYAVILMRNYNNGSTNLVKSEMDLLKAL